jgi:glycosyltransferase involved in cell wall biosynthesis
MPTVSVIIPTYNRAPMLEEAIGSVLKQDFADFEVVVVDDGSEDDTPQRITAYPGIRIVTQSHRGVSAARNAGIRASCGDLVAFLDSDDLWFTEKLSCQVAFFNANPQALICQTEEIWIRNGVRVNPGKRHQKTSGMIFERSVALCLVSPSAVMLRRSLLEVVGLFDEKMPACEDYDLWLRVSCRFPIHLIDTPLVIKRGGHPDQLSKQRRLDRYRIYALTKILKSPPPQGLTASQRSAALHALREKCSIYAAGCLKRDRREEAVKYLELRDMFCIEPPESSSC